MASANMYIARSIATTPFTTNADHLAKQDY